MSSVLILRTDLLGGQIVLAINNYTLKVTELSVEGRRLEGAKFITLPGRKKDRRKEDGKEMLRNLQNSYIIG